MEVLQKNYKLNSLLSLNDRTVFTTKTVALTLNRMGFLYK